MLSLPADFRAAIKEAGNRPIYAENSDTGETFVLMSIKAYEELENGLWPGRLTNEEQIYLLREAGLRAGWDNPEMDIYNDLDPRKKDGGSSK